MLIEEHRKRKTGAVYWTVTAQTGVELEACQNRLKPSKFGNSSGKAFYTYDAEIISNLKQEFYTTQTTTDDKEESEMSKEEIESLDMSELRKRGAEKAKSEGRPTTELRTKWKREHIAAYLESGVYHDVNTVNVYASHEVIAGAAMGGNDAGMALLAKMIEPHLTQVNIDMDTVRDIISEEISRATKNITVTRWDGVTVDCGKQHKEFEQILPLIRKRKHTLLVGPPGTGKTYTAQALAKALGLDFYTCSVGQQTTKSDLMGFTDIHGKPVWTELKKAFINGGMFLLDEIDAGNANVLVVLNSMLANGHCAFPDGLFERHKDFVCMAAANTYGRGGDRLFVGRNQLDGASLDRFLLRVFDVDEDLELTLSPNEGWTRRVQAYRKAAADLKLQVIISPRASYHGDLLDDGYSIDALENMAIWKGMPQDQINKIKAAACI